MISIAVLRCLFVVYSIVHVCQSRSVATKENSELNCSTCTGKHEQCGQNIEMRFRSNFEEYLKDYLKCLGELETCQKSQCGGIQISQDYFKKMQHKANAMTRAYTRFQIKILKLSLM